jgi:outer membrane protein OmpA-like peptidoglycan-associated protein
VGKTLLDGARILRKAVFTAAMLAGWAACGTSALAQTMSNAELVSRFRAQIQSIRAATSADQSLGATRGLVLAGPGQDAATEVKIEAEPDASPAGGVLTLTPESGTSEVASSESTTMTHWELPRSEQVNVQITFAFDSSALSAAQKPKLQQICQVLDAAGVNILRIVGHTDASGPWSYNQKLSELRAEEVMRYFVNECGVPADRLQAVGVGEQFPYDDKNPRAGVNRRVEFQAMS